ncbi:MAG TPA: BrnA antitoxin family protein [Rhizomicrobium sp.]|nr:BrnA antitoxin family protein [Rhizomicrobium sp.]
MPARRKPTTVSDDDIPEMSAEDFARAKPARKVAPQVVAAMKHARGRPKLEKPKQHVTLRLDAAVVEAFKAQGPGWQSRINDALARVIAHKRTRRKAA